MKTVAQQIAECIASDVTTLLYCRAYENISTDPERIRNGYIEWVMNVVNKILKDNAPDKQTTEKLFTDTEVKNVLCDACRLGIPDIWHDEAITHYCGEVAIPCKATTWRKSKVAR